MSSLITIKLLGENPVIWKAEDWLRLQELGIYGTFIGAPATCQRQVSENALPVLLMPEEVTFILEKNIGKLYRYKENREFPNKEMSKWYDNFFEQNKNQQKEHYKELCTEQVKEKIDMIMEGKKRKAKKRKIEEGLAAEETESEEIDKEKVLEEEVQRRLAVATSAVLMELPTESPFLGPEDLEEAEWDYPKTEKEKVRYAVYKDLNSKGYSITPGIKFGGDFLAYPGMHWKFHAYWIVKCMEYEEEMKMKDMISGSRLGVVTRKNMVLSSVDKDGKVTYTTFIWPGK